MTQPVFRFAPSPNGYLHLGHALSALTDFEMARAMGGRFLLRMEDIDPTRCRPEFEEAIYQDLVWLGVEWEQPVRRQSEHLDAYRAALGKLETQGLVYPSFESRAEIARLVSEREVKAHWPRDPDGAPLYPGSAKKLTLEEREKCIAAGDPYALRLDMNAALRAPGADLGRGRHRSCRRTRNPDGASGGWGDVVLGRKETPTSYHLRRHR